MGAWRLVVDAWVYWVYLVVGAVWWIRGNSVAFAGSASVSESDRETRKIV